MTGSSISAIPPVLRETRYQMHLIKKMLNYLVLSTFCGLSNHSLIVNSLYSTYCKQIKDGFSEGKDLVVSVMSAMGEEQICALKDIGPK